ncbi:MAG: ABC transporter permease [Thermoproteota archaeon]
MLDAEVAEIAARSVYVSGLATLLAASWSLPLAYVMAIRGRMRLLASLFESLVGVPTVLVGLVIYMLFSRKGPLGFLGLLYTPYAIVVGEAFLVTPLIVSVMHRVLQSAVKRYWELAVSLGASERQAMLTAFAQSLPAVVASIVMGFSRAIGELGVALLVGGNIKGYTRTLTTAIALEVSKGEFEDAVALGLVLVAIVAAFSAAARILWRGEEL